MAKKIFVAFLKKHKNKNIFLDVKKDNKRAIQFYKKNGLKKLELLNLVIFRNYYEKK